MYRCLQRLDQHSIKDHREQTRISTESLSVLLKSKFDGRRIRTSLIGSMDLFFNESIGSDSIERKTEEVFICHC